LEPNHQVFIDDASLPDVLEPYMEAAKTLKTLGLPVVYNTKSENSYRLEAFGFDKEGEYPQVCDTALPSPLTPITTRSPSPPPDRSAG
jgi:hypothetical protein